MEPGEFVTFAGRSVIHGKAGARSAISRAYHGVFHVARELLMQLGGNVPGSGKSHNLVSQFRWSSKHESACAPARIIASLHGDRIEADYKLSAHGCEDLAFAKSRVELATDAISLQTHFRNDCLANPQLLQNLRDRVARVKSIHQA